MVVDGKDVFMPESWLKYVVKTHDGTMSVRRQHTKIRYPLRSLQKNCEWSIVNSMVDDVEDIINLNVPKSLKLDLEETYLESLHYNHPMSPRL